MEKGTVSVLETQTDVNSFTVCDLFSSFSLSGQIGSTRSI